MVEARGFASRSHAVNDMLHQFLVEHKNTIGDDVMVGVITLLYNNSVPGLQKQLADLQVRYIDEVITSLHVHLMHNQTMEAVLVQGPARKLRDDRRQDDFAPRRHLRQDASRCCPDPATASLHRRKAASKRSVLMPDPFTRRSRKAGLFAPPLRERRHHPDFDRMETQGWKAADAEGKLSEQAWRKEQQWALAQRAFPAPTA